MYRIRSKDQTITEAPTFKEALRSAENARRMVFVNSIEILTPSGNTIHYFSRNK